MDEVEGLWSCDDLDGALKEGQKLLTSGTKDQDTINQALLLLAYVHFQQGRLYQSNELLSKVYFLAFDVHQWTVENNILVIQYLKANKSIVEKNGVNVPVLQNFALLLEKIQGLPCHNVMLLETYVSFNFGVAFLVSNARENHDGIILPGGYDLCQTKIKLTIQRVLGIGLNAESDTTNHCDTTLSVIDKLRYFCEGGGSLEKLDEVSFPFSWLCWLLSLFWLIDQKVEEACQLIELVAKLTKLKPRSTFPTKKVVLPYSILKEELNQENIVEASDLLSAACSLVLCHGLFLNHNKKEALVQCGLSLSAKAEFIPTLLMKGLLLYENATYNEALQPLQRILELTDDKYYKATALNICGCICAKLGRPHTALIQFGNSFGSSNSHVEALYNVGLLYHEMKNYDLEISLLRQLLQVLSSKNENKTFSEKLINLSFVTGILSRIIDRVISNDHFLISTDIYCVQNNFPNNPRLNRHVVLYKIAHVCFQQKRYTEAAESFIDLLALLEDKPLDPQKVRLPNLVAIFHETAAALCQSDRHEDTLIICDKVLLDRQVFSQDAQNLAAKRSQENVLAAKSWMDTKSLVGILLYKAEALIRLERPVEAHEIYRSSILDMMTKEYQKQGRHQSNEQDQKRQKTDFGSKGIPQCDAESRRNVEEFEKVKALVFNKEGTLLKSLGRNGDALLSFALSVSCHPSCTKYHYDHTSLLFEMGRNEEACKNWFKVRNLGAKDVDDTKTMEMTTFRETFRESFYLNDEDSVSLYIEMDAMVLRNSRSKY